MIAAELALSTTSREAGRVRLRTWVDVERVETTVPVDLERGDRSGRRAAPVAGSGGLGGLDG